MVEIEEIKDDGGSAKKEGDENRPPPPPGKKYRYKNDVPSVAHLLAHGSPESQNKPKTFCSVYGYPIAVAITFAISLLIFHHAYHEKSVQPIGKYSLSNMQRPPPPKVIPPKTVANNNEQALPKTHNLDPEENEHVAPTTNHLDPEDKLERNEAEPTPDGEL